MTQDAARTHDALAPTDASFLDYLTTVRNFAIREWFPAVAGEVEAIRVDAGLGDQISPDEYRGIAGDVDERLAVGAWKRIMRSQQQMTWARLFSGARANESDWLARFENAIDKNPTGLVVDPDFNVPESACEDIHLQPGGYCRDDLAGPVFMHGTRVFYQGDNDNDEIQLGYVENCLRAPADGVVKRVVDLGCSIGQCTTALKQRFSDAEVWGVDVGLPMLKYGHLRATELDIDVRFKHGLAEDLSFLEDGSVDVVFAFILFHEVPQHTFMPILKEAFRVLRPGGTLTVVDAPNSKAMPSPNQMWLAFDARYNCEPYSPAFVAADFCGLVGEAGFGDIEQGPTPDFLSQTTAVKPT